LFQIVSRKILVGETLKYISRKSKSIYKGGFEMKKLLALTIALLVIGMAVASATAQQVGTQRNVRARIKTLGAFGNGLAVSEDSPMEFELIKIGVAKLKVGLADEETEVKTGILYFGEDKYRLRNVVIGNGSASADIYLNDTQVGSISLNSYPKGDKEVWAGQAKRLVKPLEKAEKTFEYCKNNPDKCNAAMKAVGQIVCDPVTDGNCRNRIKNFCEQYPDDNRCKALRFAHCKIDLEDADCRAEIMGVCRNNATETACQRLGEVYNKFVERRPEVLQNVPRWFTTVRERLQQQGQLGGEGE
jgi:hypothetical protein